MYWNNEKFLGIHFRPKLFESQFLRFVNYWGGNWKSYRSKWEANLNFTIIPELPKRFDFANIVNNWILWNNNVKFSAIAEKNQHNTPFIRVHSILDKRRQFRILIRFYVLCVTAVMLYYFAVPGRAGLPRERHLWDCPLPPTISTSSKSTEKTEITWAVMRTVMWTVSGFYFSFSVHFV